MHCFVSTTFRVLATIGLNFNLKTVAIRCLVVFPIITKLRYALLKQDGMTLHATQVSGNIVILVFLVTIHKPG